MKIFLILAIVGLAAMANPALGQMGGGETATNSAAEAVGGVKLKGVVVQQGSIFLIDGLGAKAAAEALEYKLDVTGAVVDRNGKKYQIPDGQMLTAEGRYVPIPKGVVGLPTEKEVVVTPSTSPAEPAPPKDGSASMKSELERQAAIKNIATPGATNRVEGSGLTGPESGTIRTEPGKIINPGKTNSTVPH